MEAIIFILIIIAVCLIGMLIFSRLQLADQKEIIDLYEQKDINLQQIIANYKKQVAAYKRIVESYQQDNKKTTP